MHTHVGMWYVGWYVCMLAYGYGKRPRSMVPHSLAVNHNNIRYIHSVIVMLVQYTSSSLVTLSDREGAFVVKITTTKYIPLVLKAYGRLSNQA